MIRQATDPLGAAWARFAERLGAQAPASRAALRRIAFARELAILERQLGFRLHPELRALLRLHNGAEDGIAAAFLPLLHRPIGTAEIADTYEGLLDLGWHEEDSPWPEDHLSGHTHQWVPFALPIDGGVAFVDHRPGPTYGHVYEMGIGSGDSEGSLWATSLSALFDRLADVLDGRADFLRYRPRIEESALTWDVLTDR